MGWPPKPWQQRQADSGEFWRLLTQTIWSTADEISSNLANTELLLYNYYKKICNNNCKIYMLVNSALTFPRARSMLE
jgi:hypothetical protein